MTKLTLIDRHDSYALVLLKMTDEKDRKALYKDKLYKDLSPKARRIANKIIKGKL